jgi:Zn-dependent protease
LSSPPHTPPPPPEQSEGPSWQRPAPYSEWPPPPPGEHERWGKEEQKPIRKRIGGGIAVIGVLIAKFAAKFKALLLLFPKLKLLTTAGTALVSVAAYALIWGWQFAAGFVVLLFIHEMGHVIALRREGIPASAPMFIPFMGAVVFSKHLGGNALKEAKVGLAGPVLGSIGAALCIPIWHATGNDMFRALAYTGFFLNLFNLVPLVPFDGGRAMAALAPWMWFVGFAGMVVFAFVFPNPILILFLVLGGLETWRRWKARRAGGEAEAAYYRVPPAARLAVAAVYIGLVLALAFGMHATYIARTFGDA